MLLWNVEEIIAVPLCMMKGKYMVKIHILGGPGSGKTTLAQNLAAKFHVPHYDLDQIGWKNGDRMAAYIDDASAIAKHLLRPIRIRIRIVGLIIV